jgi:N-dimethylarginine dimethylaminohydrolase
MGVTSEYGKLRSVLLCEPTYFQLEPINVIAREFIRKGQLPAREQVECEHQRMAQAFVDFGTEVVWVEPDPRLTYQVFTRDIGVTTRDGVLLGTFREKVRWGEEAKAAEVLVHYVPVYRRIEAGEGIAFEGGDYMYVDDHTVALGIGARTTPKGAEIVIEAGSEQGVEVIPVHFDPKYLHLDMIFNVVGERVCVICKEALPYDFLKKVEQWKFETIEVAPEEVFRLSCNLIALDRGMVMSPARNTEVNQQLKALGFEVIEVELEHLLKGGGGPHCMSFPLERQ